MMHKLFLTYYANEIELLAMQASMHYPMFAM